tara:strand:- start:27 stop:362 length:336 start_codon:yes stop_codon:yes gene_type:complete
MINKSFNIYFYINIYIDINIDIDIIYMINIQSIYKNIKSSDLCILPGFCIDYENKVNTTKLDNYVLNNTFYKEEEYNQLLKRVQIKSNNSRKNIKPHKQKTKKSKIKINKK